MSCAYADRCGVAVHQRNSAYSSEISPFFVEQNNLSFIIHCVWVINSKIFQIHLIIDTAVLILQ